MGAQEIDRSDPAVRAARAVAASEHRQRVGRTLAALALGALAVAGPFVAGPLTGGPGAVFGAVLASVLLAGCAATIWPWTWSNAEREHHTLAAIWDQARPDTRVDTAWDRYAAWARSDADRVELVLIRRAGTTDTAAPSPFSQSVRNRLDADAALEATEAMETLRADATRLEQDARDRHEAAVARAERKPYEDALREVEHSAAEHQRRAEDEMRRDLA